MTDASVKTSGDVEGALMKQEIMTELRKSTRLSAGNLAFPAFISPQLYVMCENLQYESVYFKELHKDQGCN